MSSSPRPASPLSVTPASPVPADRARHAIALVSIAALALLFTGRRAVHRPPLLEGAWALDAWLALPLAGALLIEARRYGTRIAAAIAGLLALAPLIARTWLPGGRAWIGAHPAALLVSAIAAVGVALVAGRGHGLRLADWGLGVGDWRWWLPRTLGLAGLAWSLGIGSAAVIPELASFYPDYPPAREDALVLVGTLAASGLTMIGWEFLFRGYLLFGLARSAGPIFAILCQALPFFLAHRAGPDTELIASFVGGCLLAAFCWRSGSAWPAPLLHWSINAGVQVGGALF